MTLTETDSARTVKPALQYAQPQPMWMRRSLRRRVTLCLLLLAAGLMTWGFGRAVIERVVLLNAQRNCLAAVLPADKVVYENHPSRARSLATADSRYVMLGSSGPACWYSKNWETLNRLVSPPGGKPAATLFCGELVSPGGNRRLVVVEAYRESTDSTGQGILLFKSTVVVPGSLLNPPRVQPPAILSHPAGDVLPFDRRFPLRIFAAQPDRSDRSHFSCKMEMNDMICTFEGSLRDDDRVSLAAVPEGESPIR